LIGSGGTGDEVGPAPGCARQAVIKVQIEVEVKIQVKIEGREGAFNGGCRLLIPARPSGIV